MSYNHYLAMRKPPLWVPIADAALLSVDIHAGRGTRIFTTDAKTTPAVNLTDGIGAIVQEGGVGADFLQSSLTRRYTLAQMSDGQWAASGDNSDDGLFTSSINFAPGARTFGFRAQYHTLPVGSELDVLLQVGGSSASIRVSLGGPTYSFPGLIFSGGNSGAGSSQIRYAAFSPSVGVPFTIFIAYNGVQANIKTNYRLWVDGVEIPNASLTSAASAGGVASSTLLNYQSAQNQPAGAMLSKAFVIDGYKPELQAVAQDYMVRL